MASAALTDEENEFLEQDHAVNEIQCCYKQPDESMGVYFNNPHNITLGHNLASLNSCIMIWIASYIYYCRPAEQVEQTHATEYHALSFSVRCCSSKYSSVYWNCF